MIRIIASDLFTISKITNPRKKSNTGYDISPSLTMSAAFAYKNPALTIVQHQSGIIMYNTGLKYFTPKSPTTPIVNEKVPNTS